MNTTIDPVRESVEAIAAIKAPTLNEVASPRGHDWREAFSTATAAVSPVVDMVPHPTDEHVLLTPQLRQIDLGDHEAAFHFSPHPTGNTYPDYASQLLQTIASNMGIPTAVLTVEPMSSGRTEASIHLQMFNARIEAQAAALREWFQPAIVALHKAFVQFSDAFFLAACLLYRELVGRLPGSNRTSRLRKKRRDRVLDWYLNTYLPGDQE